MIHINVENSISDIHVKPHKRPSSKKSDEMMSIESEGNKSHKIKRDTDI